MQTATLTILSLAFIGAALAGPIVTDFNADTDSRILNLLAESTALSNSANPQLATKCFSHYLPLLNQTSVKFSKAYKQCVTAAKTATSNLNANATAKQSTLTAEAKVICNAFTECNREEADYVEFYECYASAASGDVSKIYAMSVSALDAALTLKSGLQQIKSSEKLCTDDAQSIYTTQSTQVYSELKACFSDGLPATAVPTTPNAAPQTTITHKTTTPDYY